MNKSQCPRCECMKKVIPYLMRDEGPTRFCNYGIDCRIDKTQPRASNTGNTDITSVVDSNPSTLMQRHVATPWDHCSETITNQTIQDMAQKLVIDSTTLVDVSVLSVKDRLEAMKLSLDLIRSNKTTPFEQLRILNGFIDQFMDENRKIAVFAVDAVYHFACDYRLVFDKDKKVFRREKILDAEIANTVVYRFMKLLREMGFIEQRIWLHCVQISILESLVVFIQLAKINDSKKLHDVIMCLIETLKNTTDIGRRHILDAIEDLQRTDNSDFDNETINFVKWAIRDSYRIYTRSSRQERIAYIERNSTAV